MQRVAAAASLAVISGLATAVGLLAALPVLLARAGADRIGQVRDAPTARLPGLSLTLERRVLHGFLAEYDRTLIDARYAYAVAAGPARATVRAAARSAVCAGVLGAFEPDADRTLRFRPAADGAG